MPTFASAFYGTLQYSYCCYYGTCYYGCNCYYVTGYYCFYGTVCSVYTLLRSVCYTRSLPGLNTQLRNRHWSSLSSILNSQSCSSSTYHSSNWWPHRQRQRQMKTQIKTKTDTENTDTETTDIDTDIDNRQRQTKTQTDTLWTLLPFCDCLYLTYFC